MKSFKEKEKRANDEEDQFNHESYKNLIELEEIYFTIGKNIRFILFKYLTIKIIQNFIRL